MCEFLGSPQNEFRWDPIPKQHKVYVHVLNYG